MGVPDGAGFLCQELLQPHGPHENGDNRLQMLEAGYNCALGKTANPNSPATALISLKTLEQISELNSGKKANWGST